MNETCDICKTREAQDEPVYLPGFKPFSHYANVCIECWGVKFDFTNKWDQQKNQYDQDRAALENKTQETRTSILSQWKEAADR